MASSSSRCSVVVGVSPAMAMLIAASSVKVVAAAADKQVACNIEEVTVNNTAEVITSGTAFKMTVLCDNTVQRVLRKGDHCFCELLSRAEAKLGRSMDGSFCDQKEKISRCRGAAPSCSIPDGDVQYCVSAILEPLKGKLEDPSELVGQQVEAPFFRPSVAECCSKVSKLSAACACEFGNALQKTVGNAGIDLKRTDLPCMDAISGDCARQ